VVFTQVGSNDGVTSDPLRSLVDRYAWTGILVEPVPHVFERLRAARGGNPRLVLENVAIADRDGEAPFYHMGDRPGDDSLPPWYDQLGSFSLETLLSHEEQIPGIRDLVVSTTAPCMTFDSLCRKLGLAHVDVLHVDAEGYGLGDPAHRRLRPVPAGGAPVRAQAPGRGRPSGLPRAAGLVRVLVPRRSVRGHRVPQHRRPRRRAPPACLEADRSRRPLCRLTSP
jgi:FkbM family methyltransferase